MKKSIYKKLVLLLAVAALALFSACENEGPAEKAGEKIDEAVEETQEGMEEAGDAMEDAAEETGDAIEEAGDEMQNQ